MKKYWQICLMLCGLLLVQFVAVPVSATVDYDVSVTQGCNGIDSCVPYLGTEQKVSNAEAIVLYESTTDTLMYAWNADQPMYPASFVKIMTALVAIEQADVEDIITVKASSLTQLPSDAASVYLQVDEIITLEQLIYCLLVESANDAAIVIADHVGGSQERFVSMMNARAAELGCTGTNFTNPHGLHNENQITTARDMAKILTAAMENELFRKYFSTSQYAVDPTNKSDARYLASGNHMMHKITYEIYYDTRVIGGRTGIDNNGTNCLATAARKGNMELICIVMGSRTTYVPTSGVIDRIGGFDETKKLLDLGFKGFQGAQILYENQALQQHTIADGDADVVIGPQTSISTVVPTGSSLNDLNFRYSMPLSDLRAPIEKGQHIMDLEIWDGNVCVGFAPLYALNSVDVMQISVVDTYQEASGSVIGTVFLVILVLAVLVFVALFILRLINGRRHKASARRRRR